MWSCAGLLVTPEETVMIIATALVDLAQPERLPRADWSEISRTSGSRPAANGCFPPKLAVPNVRSRAVDTAARIDRYAPEADIGIVPESGR
jgi:hypothetical protein